MSLPRATYRLQFREGMDFDRAAALAPYLARLGVSHLYASPLFQAAPGSTHGYDVTDHGRFDEALGGMKGFLRLSAALKAAGLGLILDIVPNHMAAATENPWWRDVLRHGPSSAFAGHFDIDWSAPKLLLPRLGQPFGAALAAGEFSLDCDGEGLNWRYYEHRFPLTPESWRLVLEPAGLALPSPGDLPAWLAEPANAGRLTLRLEALSGDRALLARIHEAQAWRLAYWRAGRDGLTYRRFFEIADLVGVRIEDGRVFDDVHRFLFELIEAGHLDGVRVDHVDGLADPAGYLHRLKAEAPREIMIWVEKILAADEELPNGWPVAGTTGYEFARLAGALLTDPTGAEELVRCYRGFTGQSASPTALTLAAKREILAFNLASELSVLTDLALRAAARDATACDWGEDSLRRALIALAVAMPVYRTYLDAGSTSPQDAAVLARVEQDAQAAAELDDPSAVSDLLRLIRSGQSAEARRLRVRFQQTTGALMAKAVEDTLFYRTSCLLSANEVGNEPGEPSIDAETFDRTVRARRERQPGGLNATATHDTKRGEDARMRIAAIADNPRTWAEAVAAWDRILAEDSEPLPEAELRWHFYQALLGAWSEDGDLAERMATYLLKAAREAKQATSWTRQNEDYERALLRFVNRALSENQRFTAAFTERAAPFIAAGARKSLVQLALKLTLPGIPDIYQGTEWADLSLVDPDNRQPIDFDARIAALETSSAPDSVFDRTKMTLLGYLLDAHRDQPELFEKGGYCALENAASCRGRYLGFGRQYERTVLLVVSELSAPPGEPTEAPVFVLPSCWGSIAFRALFPEAEIDRRKDTVSPRGGFERFPVIAAFGRKEM